MRLWIIWSALAALPAWAQEAPETGASGEVESATESLDEGGDAEAEPEPEPEPAKKKKVRIVREKETDGTQAANRFKGDPVIRSRYQLNGQPLEVDPD